jgi:hypothetical protein
MLKKLFGGKKDGEEEDDAVASDREAEIFNQGSDEQLLRTEHDRGSLQQDIHSRESDLKKLKTQIRGHWKKYKDCLEKAKDSKGIDGLEAKTKAKQAKKAAVDKQRLYKLLWKELSAMKNALRKDETMKIVSGSFYNIDLSEINVSEVEAVAEEHSQDMMERQMTVEEFKSGLETIEEDDVQIDFSDIEKDVAELEMENVEIFWEEEEGKGENYEEFTAEELAEMEETADGDDLEPLF